MRRNFSMSGSAGRGELGPGDKACSCWGPHLCCPHHCCSPGTGGGRCPWPNFAVWWKDPDRKTSTLTCFAFTACLWRGVKMWKLHTLYFNEKTKREVKLFHFENTRKIFSCHPSTHILSVQTCLIWCEICLKWIYTQQIYYLSRNATVYRFVSSKQIFYDSQDRQNKCNYVKQGLLGLCLSPAESEHEVGEWQQGQFCKCGLFPLNSSTLPLAIGQHKCSSTAEACIFPRTDEVRELSLLQSHTVNSGKFFCLNLEDSSCGPRYL